MGTRSKKNQNSVFTELVNLTRQEVLRLPKPRAGFTSYAEPLFKLYEQYLAHMPLKGGSIEAARSALAAYLALVDQENDLLSQLALVQETRALKGAGVWSVMLDIYAGAQYAARNNATIAHAIDAFSRFMRSPHRRTTAPVTPTTTQS